MRHTAVIILVIVLGSPAVWAYEKSGSQRRRMLDESKAFEVSALASYMIDFDDNIVGGTVRFTYSPIRVFALGLETGAERVLDFEGRYTIVPIDLVLEADIPVGRERVSVPISFITGYMAQVGLSNAGLLTCQIESGVKVRINDWIGVAALMQGGMVYPMEYWPIPVLGFKVGPFFSFYRLRRPASPPTPGGGPPRRRALRRRVPRRESDPD